MIQKDNNRNKILIIKYIAKIHTYIFQIFPSSMTFWFLQQTITNFNKEIFTKKKI